MTRLILSFLGPLQFTLAGEPVTSFRSDKERALLAFLALEADRPHRREALIGLLWPEQPQTLAFNNLRKTLHRLRQTLRDPLPDTLEAGQPGETDGPSRQVQDAPAPFLLITPKTVQFNPKSDYQLDVAEFTTLLDACQQHPHRHLETCVSCNQRLRQAVDLYRGEFLHGFFLADCLAFDEWALVKREGLHWQALEAFYTLTQFYSRRREYNPAQRYALRQLALEPWRESAYRQLMQVLAWRGERNAALAQYETCRRVLAEELGVEPEVETRELYERLKMEQSNKGVDEPALGLLPTSAPLPNLLTYMTPFIGREVEIERLTARLFNPAYRLVTLVGEGGIGKTRLALAAAERVREDFFQGVWFVPLAGLTGGELPARAGEGGYLHNLLSTAIANALGLTLFGKEEPKQQLINYLRPKELLLVLDNFEHLLAGAELILEILKVAPKVVILATSREPLNFQVEQVMRLEGLPVPPVANDPAAASYDSVQLFAERARRGVEWFGLDASTLPAVAQICQFLDGLPLGIELAAAWTQWLTPTEIVQRLRQIDFLATIQRDVVVRHRSIRAVFEGSWTLLSPHQQAILMQASVFRGGFSEVAAAVALEAKPVDLEALVYKSLLRQTATGRYEMHELLRQFAEEMLEAEGETLKAAFRDRHLEHLLWLAEESQVKLNGPEQLAWLDRLEAEHDNFRVALDWSLNDPERSEKGLRLVGALGWYWQLHEYFNEGTQWLLHLLDNTHPDAITGSRAKALYFVGQLAWYQGEFATALPYLQQSVEIGRALGDEHHLAYATALLTVVQVIQKQITVSTAFALLEQSLARMRAEHDDWGLSFVLNRCGYVAVEDQDYTRAWAYYQEALDRRRRLGNQRDLSASLSNLGEVARLRGDYSRAVEFYEEAIAIGEQHGSLAYTAEARNNLGYVLYHLGDYQRALSLFARGVIQLQTLGIKHSILAGLAGIGCVWAAQGRVREAARVFSVVERELTSSGLSLFTTDQADYKAGIENARVRQGAEVFASAWAEGGGWTLQEALAYAVGQIS